MTTVAAVLAALLLSAPSRPADLGPAPFAPAGARLSPLPDDPASPWRLALTTGVAGRFGGREKASGKDYNPVLLDFGGQADGSWPDGHGQAVRMRFRLLTGGESDIYVPSDGEAEFAYMLGRQEFRFVLLRAEVARYTGLALQGFAQAGTLPCFDGTVAFAGNRMEISYFVSPVEAAWVRYKGRDHLTHLPGWTTEDDKPGAASAARLRYTVILPADFALSVQADFAKFWHQADMLLGAEGTVGYRLPRQATAFHVGVRATSYTRRGLAKDTSTSSGEVLAVAAASIGF